MRPNLSDAKRASSRDVEEVVRFFSAKPSPFPLVRIGGKSDGAYLLPNCLDGIRACFSPGVANRKSFEDQLLEDFGIQSFLLDFSSSEAEFTTPLVEGKQFFTKKWLSSQRGTDNVSLSKWVSDQQLDAMEDLLLQMDIEGAEYENMLSTPRDVLARFRIIVLEIHDVAERLLDGRFSQSLGPVIELLSKDFVVVHNHPNNCCGAFHFPDARSTIPQTFELTMLRRDYAALRVGGRMFPPRSPHRLDIARNDLDRGPLILGKEWVPNQPRVSRAIQILRFMLEYSAFLILRPPLLWARLNVEGYRLKRKVLSMVVAQKSGSDG